MKAVVMIKKPVREETLIEMMGMINDKVYK